MIAQSKRADPGRSTLSTGALAGASLSNPGKEMTMNTYITLPGGSAMLTMSSREIAELTGKRHDHVLRDIRAYVGARIKMDRGESVKSLDWSGHEGRKLFGDTPIGGVTASYETHPQNGQQYQVYNLDKAATLTVVSGYNVLLRAKIIDRWLELERVAVRPQIEDVTNLALLDLSDRARADSEIVRDLVAGEARNTRGAVIKAIRELAASPLASLKQYLDDRFMASRERDKMVLGGMQSLGKGLAEVLRVNGAVVELARQSVDPGTFIGEDWVTVQGIYAIAGVPVPVIRQRSLSARVIASLTAYCFEADRQMDVRSPPFDRKTRLYRASLVRDWLEARGTQLIHEHIARHGDQNVIRFPGSTNGEGE